jgi:predicted phage tail protein
VATGGYSARVAESPSQSRQSADLEDVEGARKDLAAATAAGEPMVGAYLRQLADRLFTRSQRTGGAADLDEAIDLARRAIVSSPADDPDRSVYMANLANLLLARFRLAGQAQDLDEALALGRQALAESGPDDARRPQYLASLADALITRANALSESGDPRREAARDIDEILALTAPAPDPTLDGGRALTLRASALRLTGRYEEAEQVLRQVLAAAPDNARASSELAQVLRLTGRQEEASSLPASAVPGGGGPEASARPEEPQVSEAPAAGEAGPAAPEAEAVAQSEVPAARAEPPSGSAGPELSRSAHDVVGLAAGLAGRRPPDATMVLLAALHFSRDTSLPGVTSALLAALADRQPDAGDMTALLQRLDRAVGASQTPVAIVISDSRQLVGSVSIDEAARFAELPPLSLLLAVAADAAERISDSREVHLRHLVLATVLANDPPLRDEFLAELGVTAAELRLIMREAARAETTGEPIDRWVTLLPASSQLAGGIDADLVDPRRRIPLDQDSLDVGVWVSMLAAVIADQDTPMPLSVGIFGEWGSGKSYFMGLLRSEIDRLSDSRRIPYLPHIVQIGFNAWHYADTNLWASLGDEIFRQLAGPSETPDEGRRRLREDLAKGSAERQVLEERTAQARDETMRLQAELERAAAQRQVRAVDLLRAVGDSAELRKQLDKVWQRLGISDETQQAQILADEVRGTAQEVGALRSLLGQQRIWVLGGVCVIALLAIVTAAWIPVSWYKWLASAGTTTLAVALGVGVTLLARARNGLIQLRTIASQIVSGMETSAQQRTAEALRPAVDQLRRAEANEKVAQAQLDEVVARVGQLAQQLSDLMPGQRLYAFLAERAASGAYTRQLGLISTIRKDFEHLVELLKDRDAEGDDDKPPRRPIDRIVLYIDDLDRCDPRQVVAVLQAVHLLLALDLFVVVGVDPRWLLRSLRHQFQEIIDVEEPGAQPDPGLWDVTPQNYLEKIFNIPFVLPGIPAGGLDRVLRGLAGANGTGRVARTSASADTAAGPARVTAPQDRVSLSRQELADMGLITPIEAELPIEAHSELAARHAAAAEEPPRPLTERELELLGGLDSFVDTPREAKRLFNLYRMLRSTRNLSDASSFLGDGSTPGEYQAVAVLLGMLTAGADLMGQVMDAPPSSDPPARGGLACRPTSDHWHDFVADLAPERSGDGWTNKIVGNLSLEEVQVWQRCAAAAAQVNVLITLPDLGAFQLWAPRIRRFSFLLLGLNVPPLAGTRRRY